MLLNLNSNQPTFKPPVAAQQDVYLQPLIKAIDEAFQDTLRQFRRIDFGANLSSLVIGDEIWIHKDALITGETKLSHIGPSTADASKDTQTMVYSHDANSITFTGQKISFDAKGHRAGLADGNVLTISGDEKWVHVDGPSGQIQHLPPNSGDGLTDNAGVVIANGANSITFTPNDLKTDAKGHRYELDAGTAFGLSGDHTWIDVTAVSSVASRVDHLDPSTATRVITIDGNDTWITGSGTVDADAKGHVNDSTKSIHLLHSDPHSATRVITIDGNDHWIVGSGTVNADAKGHVPDSTKSIHFTHADADTESSGKRQVIEGNDAWIIVNAGGNGHIAFDAKGHLASDGQTFDFTHGAVQAATNHYLTCGASLAGSTVTITPYKVDVDAKGHVASTTAQTPVTFDVSGIIIADGYKTTATPIAGGYQIDWLGIDIEDCGGGAVSGTATLIKFGRGFAIVAAARGGGDPGDKVTANLDLQSSCIDAIEISNSEGVDCGALLKLKSTWTGNDKRRLDDVHLDIVGTQLVLTKKIKTETWACGIKLSEVDAADEIETIDLEDCGGE